MKLSTNTIMRQIILVTKKNKTMNNLKMIPSRIRFFCVPYDDEYNYHSGLNPKILTPMSTPATVKIENNYYACYECPHIKEKRVVRLVEDGTCDKNLVPGPRLRTSNFEGCPHWYGKVFTPDGKVYEVQEKITERLLKVGKETGGDWVGYNVGEFTNRFLSKEMLLEAYDFLMEIII